MGRHCVSSVNGKCKQERFPFTFKVAPTSKVRREQYKCRVVFLRKIETYNEMLAVAAVPTELQQSHRPLHGCHKRSIWRKCVYQLEMFGRSSILDHALEIDMINLHYTLRLPTSRISITLLRFLTTIEMIKTTRLHSSSNCDWLDVCELCVIMLVGWYQTLSSK